MTFIKSIQDRSIPDEELLQLYKTTGDLDLLSKLYLRYIDMLYGVCLKYLNDNENAKDAALDIFQEIISKVQKHEVMNFKGWIYQVAKNHCLMKIRSEKKFSKASVDISLVQSEEILHLNGELDKEENFKNLHFCLGQLVSEQKKVVELFYLEKKCYNEIVEITGIEWNKVRSFIQNGRRNLKICMDKQSNR